ncbi:unnamed protein product [Heligmosomoides polygyrus]|uniref:Reverse transcriptase domain-containing protein n=1 Tax=Heligmosomoides polygyrus TaxID=6339 RepID=A0A3P8CP05_HELPZ|nr:unnamed protein product [Heligmosomoides polygyrus]
MDINCKGTVNTISWGEPPSKSRKGNCPRKEALAALLVGFRKTVLGTANNCAHPQQFSNFRDFKVDISGEEQAKCHSIYRSISLLSVSYKILTRVIPKRLKEIMDAEQPHDQARFRKNYSTVAKCHSIYRSISLLSVSYKLLTRVIPNRLNEIVNAEQPPDQARFRKNYSTVVFVDHEKAFDTMEVNALRRALQECLLHQLIELLREICSKAQSTVHLGGADVPIRVFQGVRQESKVIRLPMRTMSDTGTDLLMEALKKTIPPKR